LLARADRLEITQVHAQPAGDARFPPISSVAWREIARMEGTAGPDDDASFTILTYERADGSLYEPHAGYRALKDGVACPITARETEMAFLAEAGAIRGVCMPWSNQSGGGPWGSGPKGPWGSGPQSSGPNTPDFEEFLRRGQDRLRSILPGGLGGKGIVLIVFIAIALWGLSGFFVVQPEEIGVVLRFGKIDRYAQPGLNYHLPYPVETVMTPPALHTNRLDIGMRLIENPRGTVTHDVPEESLMLTGD